MFRQLYYRTSILLCLALLTACMSSAKITGTSAASSELKHDITKRIQRIFSDKCKKIDRIVIDSNNVAHDATGNFHHAQETWIASACGNTMRFTVTITADPKGGAFFEVLYTP